jgi:hypothetical protein
VTSQPLAWPAAQREAHVLQRDPQRFGTAGIGRHERRDLLGERLAGTPPIAATKTADPEMQHDRTARDRQIGDPSRIAAVDSPGPPMATRTRGCPGTVAQFKMNDLAHGVQGIDVQGLEMRKERCDPHEVSSGATASLTTPAPERSTADPPGGTEFWPEPLYDGAGQHPSRALLG